MINQNIGAKQHSQDLNSNERKQKKEEKSLWVKANQEGAYVPLCYLYAVYFFNLDTPELYSV